MAWEEAEVVEGAAVGAAVEGGASVAGARGRFSQGPRPFRAALYWMKA